MDTNANVAMRMYIGVNVGMSITLMEISKTVKRLI